MKKGLAIFLLIAILTSCGISIVNHKRFNYSKLKPNISTSLSINGLYYNIVGNRDHTYYWLNGYFFYADGSAFYTNIKLRDSAQEINESLLNIKNITSQSVSGKDGHFIIVGDTLKMQTFFPKQVGIYTLDVVEAFFLIDKKHNQIEETAMYCRWCRTQFSDFKKSDTAINTPPVIYKFLPLSTKPDSSTIWFKKKGWYVGS